MAYVWDNAVSIGNCLPINPASYPMRPLNTVFETSNHIQLSLIIKMCWMFLDTFFSSFLCAFSFWNTNKFTERSVQHTTASGSADNPVKSLLTYLLTPWSRVLLEKLTSFQLVKKFPAFYVDRRFITAFTSARQLPLFRTSSIHSMSPIPLPEGPS